MHPYTYVLVREDISNLQKAVQIGHAALQAGFAFDEPEKTSSIVLLSVPNEAALSAAAERLFLHGIDHHMFYEPDFGPMGYSALATKAVTSRRERNLFANYPLLEM